MPTQSNRQTQKVRVVSNNNTPSPPRRRRRRPAPPPEEAEALMPYAPSKAHARGVSAYPNRPMTFAPSVQLIQTDNGGGRIPSYFEHQLTNQATTLEQMRRQMEEELVGVREELYGYAQNPDDIARIDRNIAELRGQLDGLQQPAQPPPPPPPVAPPPQQQIQVPIIPHAPPEVNQPPNPPPPPQQQPQADQPVRTYTKYQYEIAREKVIDLFTQRSNATTKEKKEIRQRILDAGRRVGIESNNIATVRRKLEKLVKGHAI